MGMGQMMANVIARRFRFVWLADRFYLPLPAAADGELINGWLVKRYPLISFLSVAARSQK
jgi:hypothetical protein